MKRYGFSVFSLLLVAVLGSSVQADWSEKWHAFWSRVHTDFHRMNCYPEPFQSVDRRAQQAPFTTMITKGWQRQNTLGKFYFNPESQELNAAGERHLFWILTQAPEEHRNVFVVTGMSKDVAETRIDSVQQAAARLLPGQGLPNVIPTFNEPRGWSAEQIDAIDRAWLESSPSPRLPDMTTN